MIFTLFICLTACKTALVKKGEVTLVVENNGVAGNSTANLLRRLESDVLSEKPDLVIIMVGTNDMLNSKKFVSYENYHENLSSIVENIKNIDAQVLLMTPPRVDSLYLFKRHDKALFTDTPNVKLQKVKQIMEDVAKEYDAFFVDNYSVFKAKGLPQHNQDNYIRNLKNSNKEDGVHLKPIGYKLIAENVFDYLKTNNLLDKYKHIICFGDSLTKGSGASGAGTITGENYPSFLYRMLLKN
ncbi:SGNH/GDSL hydrolase family protein [Algibacter miyuki]|uniref:SGNH/GDSL hydrolase family protein n=1 Tax=Algibacter miyuki TaxID=1306933 RepID=A0ABV5H3W3_9FLAO|nr:GDSL-type esterase/lipase family protein [Algibacter miyuki]MDN3663837.1 GDSL-type esterase/lipase family protein [Algibacter miyuki]